MASGYVTAPGGLVVHLKDGSVEHRLYGDYIEESELAEHQKIEQTYLDNIDNQPRKPEHELAQRTDDAKQAVKESGVDLSAVPQNYAELDEAEAQGVVRSYKGKPNEQAQVIVHEKLTANRQAVLDEGSKAAHKKADSLLEQIKGQAADDAAVPEPTGPAYVPPVSDESGSEGVADDDAVPEEVLAAEAQAAAQAESEGAVEADQSGEAPPPAGQPGDE